MKLDNEYIHFSPERRDPLLNHARAVLDVSTRRTAAELLSDRLALKDLEYLAFKDRIRRKFEQLQHASQRATKSLRKLQRSRETVRTPLQVLERKAPLGKAVDSVSTTSGAVSLAPLPTYIPPPDTEVTDQLIQESLTLQPQQIATVASVIPHFADGIITFLVQLDGPIPQILALNATDSLPCESVGAEPQPNLLLVPTSVKNGSIQVVLPNCLVVAVNMYSPRYINYWVQKDDGSIFSLLSDNKVHAIDQLDPSQPASIAIRVAPVDNNMKRNVASDAIVAGLKRTQIFAAPCNGPCPFYHMDLVTGSAGFCGCTFKGGDQDLEVVARGVEQPTPYTASMTADACAAMSCINNDGKPALFNPFTQTCWCAVPTHVEVDDNAYSGPM